MIADSSLSMPEGANLKAEAIELAELLQGGMSDLFRQRLSVVLDKLGQNRVGTLIPLVNECLGNTGAHRIELSNSPAGSSHHATVDVVSNSRFFGNCWPVRYTVLTVGSSNHMVS